MFAACYMPPHIIPNPSVDSLSFITINECDVLATLKTIDITKASCVDNIPGKILREYVEQIAFSITMLFYKSLEAGIFPSCLKRANVIPVFKSSKRDDEHNYRPIKFVYGNMRMFIFQYVLYFYNQLGEEQ